MLKLYECILLGVRVTDNPFSSSNAPENGCYTVAASCEDAIRRSREFLRVSVDQALECRDMGEAASRSQVGNRAAIGLFQGRAPKAWLKS